jgi:hypothetical protein
MKQNIVSEAFFALDIDSAKNLQDLIVVKKADQRPLRPFLRDIEDGIGKLIVHWIDKPDHFGKRLDGRQAAVTGNGTVAPILFELI